MTYTMTTCLKNLEMSEFGFLEPMFGFPHQITHVNIVQRDLRAYNLTLNEAVDLAQNRPLCRLMSTYGATHS